MAFSNPITGGQGALIRPAIKSPNYVPGAVGWTINRDGSAEFNNLTIRGTFFGTSYILSTAGAFFYNGTPAHGNLILSIASAAGVDTFGNAYVTGLGTYAAGVNTYQLNALNGNTEIGPASSAHWLFDVVQSQFSMFDLNNNLTTQLTARSGLSDFLWLFNDPAFPFFFQLSDGGGINMGILSAIGTRPTAQDSGNAAGINVQSAPAPALGLSSNKNTSGAGSNPLIMNITAGNPTAGMPGSSDNALLDLFSVGVVGGAVDIALQGGALYRSDLPGWLTPTYATTWGPATSFGTLAGMQPLQYRIDGQDNLVIGGCFTAGATPGTAVGTVLPAYRPKSTSMYPVTLGKILAGVTTWTACYVSAAGNINMNSQLGSSATASATYIIPAQTIPLGNLP